MLNLDSIVVQRITYVSAGLRVRGYLVEPVGGDSLPAVIFNRGGNRQFGAISDTTAVIGLGPLAEHGYLIVASQYRGNAGGEEREAALAARSAMRWPERLNKKTPILLLHGSADWRVDPSEGLGMAAALYKARHPMRFVFFEGGDHGLSEHRREVTRLVQNWFDTYVRDGAPLPNLAPHGR